MKVADLLRPQDVALDLVSPDKPRLMMTLAQMASTATGLGKAAILEALQTREDFGSTGIGNGIAIPHASVPALTAPFGLFARLSQPVDFDSIDAVPVDIVFLLLMPSEKRSTDLNALSSVARQLRPASVQTGLRRAAKAGEAYLLLTTPERQA